jgi:amino-acid N-acetyltransferase
MTEPAGRDRASARTRPELRAARPADRRAIEQLLDAAQLPTVGVGDALDNFVVAQHDGRIIGVAGLELCGVNALLRSVTVVREWRGEGVGRALVERIIDEADARGVPLYLLTTTAERYFPTFGFTTISRAAAPEDIRTSEEFTVACPASATLMTRPRAIPTRRNVHG